MVTAIEVRAHRAAVIAGEDRGRVDETVAPQLVVADRSVDLLPFLLLRLQPLSEPHRRLQRHDDAGQVPFMQLRARPSQPADRLLRVSFMSYVVGPLVDD